jgi:hypothetical protein
MDGAVIGQTIVKLGTLHFAVAELPVKKRRSV